MIMNDNSDNGIIDGMKCYIIYVWICIGESNFNK